MNSTGIAKRGSTIRKIGWLTVGSMLALALLAPVANAQEGNQSGDMIAWDEALQLCTGGPDGDIVAGPGEVAWVFIHNGVDKGLTGTLSANFVTAGDLTADSYVQGGIKYIIWTGPDTLDTFSDDIDGGILTLSHVCAGTTTTTTTTSTSTTSTSTSTTTTSSTTTSSTTTSTTTVATTPAPSQQVLAETSAPSTLPPTDTFAGEASAQPSGSAMRLMLIAMAGLLAAVMVLTPAKVGNRR